jgi:hypothetical protein
VKYLPLASLLFALSASALAQAPAGIIRGRVEVRRAIPQVERRPNVNDLGMHARHEAPDLQRSVVYLESAPSLAFPDREPQRATLDQRNEMFVPHVLAITVGTTVDLAVTLLAVRSQSGSIGLASSACSAKSTRT